MVVSALKGPPPAIHSWHTLHPAANLDRMKACALAFWRATCWVQLGMQHALATEEGVNVLLKAGMLGACTQGLASCHANATGRPCNTSEDSGVRCYAVIIAVYAEHCPAVSAAMASEHMAACRAEARQEGQAGMVSRHGSGDGSGSSSTSLPPAICNGSLWTLLQRVQRSYMQSPGGESTHAGSSEDITCGAPG